MAIEHTYTWKSPGSLKIVGVRTEKLTPMKAIRRFCHECCGFCENCADEIRECPTETCALYPFRLGQAHTGRRAPKGLQKPAQSKI